LNDGRFPAAHNGASENAHIKLRGAVHIRDGQEVCQDKAFFGRQLIVFSVAHGLFPFALIFLGLMSLTTSPGHTKFLFSDSVTQDGLLH